MEVSLFYYIKIGLDHKKRGEQLFTSDYVYLIITFKLGFFRRAQFEKPEFSCLNEDFENKQQREKDSLK